MGEREVVLERDGTRLHCWEAGAGDRTFVLVHGLSSNHAHLDLLAAHLAAAGRVLSVDLRGHGASDAPDQDYSIEGFADDVAWVCDQLAVRGAVVVGHSMGGLVAVALAARSPEHVAALVMLDSLFGLPEAVRQIFGGVAEAMAGPGGLEVRRTMADGLFLEGDEHPRRAELTESMLSVPAHVVSSSFAGIAHWCTGEVLPSVPTLAVFASDERRDGSGLPAEGLPNVQVEVTTGTGHFLHLEAPEQVTPLVDAFVAAL